MGEAFAAAVAALFADRHLAEDALWRAGGTGAAVPVRVIRRSGDRLADWRGQRVATDSLLLEVPVATVAALEPGDGFEIGGELFQVVGEPLRDALRLVWTAQVRPL